MKRWLITIVLLIASTSVTAGKGPACVDYRGLKVQEVATSEIDDIAVATRTASGHPVIYVNARFAYSVSRQMEMFFLAHECAHHALAHTIRNIPFVTEQEADCWAINALYTNGLFSDHDVRIVQRELALLGKGDWTHLPGPARAINLKACIKGTVVTLMK